MTKKKYPGLADVPPPPRLLKRHGLQLWQSVLADYALEDVGSLELLCLAAQALDRAESCRARIEKDGEMIGSRANPLIRDELANRAFVSRALVRLNLGGELGSKRPVGRPVRPLVGIDYEQLERLGNGHRGWSNRA
jgi:hypothetical protein